MRKLRPFLAIFCAAAIAAPPAALAQSPGATRADEGGAWHSRFTSRYTPRVVAPINLGNSPRLESLLRAGRLYLSLQDAVALALENNLDIELQRYGPRLAEADLLRAQAGGVVRGVPTSVSQGPSSAANLQTGGGGGLQGGGGGTVGSGIGTGATGGATVVFSGTQTPTYDETIFTQYTWGHRTLTQANSFSTGIPALVFGNNQWTTGVQRGFSTGAQVQLGYTQTTQES